jgi:hypothetical protein
MAVAVSRKHADSSSLGVRTIVGVALVVNLVGYALYKKLTQGQSVLPTANLLQPSLDTEGSARRNPGEELARAQRAAGLAALEAGDYPAAVRSFSSAMKSSQAEGDTAELLRIAEELLDRAKDAPARSSARVVSAALEEAREEPREEPRRDSRPKAAPSKSSSRSQSKKEKVVASRERTSDDERPMGMLLVTSTPPGLVVEVDGRSVDLTPAKVRVEAGLHTVSIFRGSQRLHERRVELSDGSVSSIDVDVSSQLRGAQAFDSEPDRRAAPAEAPAALAPSPASNALEAELARPSREERAAPIEPSVPTSTGELHVSSSGIYGEVFINGQAFGPPPLVAKRVPTGNAVVEIKVNGVTRRSKQVEVHASRRTSVQIR